MNLSIFSTGRGVALIGTLSLMHPGHKSKGLVRGGARDLTSFALSSVVADILVLTENSARAEGAHAPMR